MSGVDDRVVAMQFDNAAFEQKLSTTLKSLDQLNKSLDFTNAQRNLGDLQKAGSSFSLGGLGTAAEGVSGKFLAMATVGITALANITNKAVDAGAQLLKSFTIAPISQGFENFSNKMTSISTILANTQSKGTNLDDVQKSLANLNDYANQTIYDFSQMTQNLGTFTAAGVDLKTSQESIKGIANVAAISGSNTEQASTAMYQLSQAMAAGQVHLQDWNSVVNAGMGGQVFQKALFDTGVALKQIPGVPVGETFEDWTKKGNSFRESLQSGWLTTKVLTTTLNSFSGDFNAAQLKQMGYSDQQAAAMVKLGESGLKAATQIKSVHALMDMLKENTAAGWSDTFQILAGNYDQAVGLFTEIGNALGGVVANSAKARNDLLKGWADLGGREVMIQGFKNAIQALKDVIVSIKEGIGEVFPAMTAKRLFDITTGFEHFTKMLIPSQATLISIHQIFTGLAAAVDIVINVVKGLGGVVVDIFKQFAGAGQGALHFTAVMLDWVRVADAWLVSGGHLKNFFDTLNSDINKVIATIKNVIGTISTFFKGSDSAAGPTNKTLHDVGETASRTKSIIDELEAAFSRLGQRYKAVAAIFDTNSAVFKRFNTIFTTIKKVLNDAWGYISKWFSQLGNQIAASLKPGDFNKALDAINVGLLGGIILMLRKFMKGGVNVDIGGGVFGQVKEALEGVTGQLQAMQTQLKAKALLEIAGALGILTISIVALSLINSDNLTKAMTALAVGFGQLVIVMKLMDQIASSNKDAAKLGILAGAMTLLAGAALILTVAVEALGRMSWEQLAKGIGGITLLLTIMIGVANQMEGNIAGMVAAGLAMIPLATGITIMAGAVKLFSLLSWADMIKGLAGVALSLGIIAGVMNAMPVFSLLAAGLAMIPLATGITILAGAIKLFSLMSWGDILKGMVGLAAGLLIIAGAMQLMPITMPITAAGLILVAVALNMMVPAIALLGRMDMATLAKGIGSIAALMVILSLAVNAMSGAVGGAIALVIVAGALDILAKVLMTLGGMSWSELGMGLAAIAGVLLVLAVAAMAMAPVVPLLLGLGVALAVVGGAFVLFGAGAYLVGKALQLMATVGKASIAALIEATKMFVVALPDLLTALIDSLAKSIEQLLSAGDLILKLLAVLIVKLLQTIITIIPPLAKAIEAILGAVIQIITDKAPDIIELGFKLLMNLLKGLYDHIGEVTLTVINILIRFVDTLTENNYRIVDAAVNLLISFLTALASRDADVVQAGIKILLSVLAGIAQNIFMIVNVAAQIAANFIEAIGRAYGQIATAGANAIINFVEGIGSNIQRVVQKGIDVAIALLDAMASDAIGFASRAATVLIKFLNGLADAINLYAPQIRSAGINVAVAMIEGLSGGLLDPKNVGKVVDGAVGAVQKAYQGAKDWLLSRSPSRRTMQLGQSMAEGVALGLDNDTTAQNSAVLHAQRIVDAFQETLSKIPDTLSGMDEFNPTITPVLDLTKVKMGARSIGDLISVSAIAPTVSTGQARLISTTTDLGSQTTPVPVAAGPSEVNFNQTINAPTALSTKDIYKQTKNQIALAKEELSI